MKKLLFLMVGFLYCNVAWQAIVWLYGLVPSLVGLSLIFVIPIGLGVALFLVFNKHVNEDWSAVFVGAGIVIPVVYMFSFATRMPEYVRYVQTGRLVYAGPIAELADDEAVFYELRDLVVKNPGDGEYGVSYSSRSQKNSTTYAKHFVIPVFAAGQPESPRVFAFGTYTSGNSKADNGARGIYGFDKTALSGKLDRNVLYGRKLSDDDASKAVADYFGRHSVKSDVAPLIVELVDESPAEYFKIAAFHFWSMAVILNLLFLGVCFYATSEPENAE